MHVFFVLVLILSASSTLFVQGGTNVISEEISMDDSIELRRVPLQQQQQQQRLQEQRLLKKHPHHGKNNQGNNNNNRNKNDDSNNNNDDDNNKAILETHDEHITPGNGFGGTTDVPSIEELQYEYDQAAAEYDTINTAAADGDLASELKNNPKEGIVIINDDNDVVAGIKNNNNNSAGGKSGKSEDTSSSMSLNNNNVRTESKQGKVGGSKSRKVSSGVCNKRLQLAYNATQQFPSDFSNIQEKEDITALCEFRPTADANFGCAGFYFDPAIDPYFFKGMYHIFIDVYYYMFYT
jgi:hypothetical protein